MGEKSAIGIEMHGGSQGKTGQQLYSYINLS